MTEAALSAFLQDYTDHVNPRSVRLLESLNMNAGYTCCEGVEVHTADGRVIPDFLPGYCVHNVGHNHPAIVRTDGLGLVKRAMNV